MFESIYQSSVISGLKYPFIKATRLRIQGITGFISIPIHRKRILTVVANNQIKYCKILRLIESKRLIYSY